MPEETIRTLEITATPAIGLATTESPQAAIERVKVALEPIVTRRMAEIAAEAEPMLKMAAAGPPRNKFEADAKSLLLGDIKRLITTIEGERKATTDPLTALSRWVMARYAPTPGALGEARDRLDEQIRAWQREEQRRADEEAERLRQEAVARARAERERIAIEQAEAAKAFAGGALPEIEAFAPEVQVAIRERIAATATPDAARLMLLAEVGREHLRLKAEAYASSEVARQAAAERDQAERQRIDREAAELAAFQAAQAEDDETEAIEAAASIRAEPVKLAGSGRVEHWAFEVLDPAAVPREYLAVDEKALRSAVKAGVREIPGVRVYRDDFLRSR